MATMTYYAALPFGRDAEGELVPGDAKECSSAANAIATAEALALTSAGAIAFSRTGDPMIGEFADAVTLRIFGNVLSVDDLVEANG